MKLIFKVKSAGQSGKSPVEIVLQTRRKLRKQTGPPKWLQSSLLAGDTDQLLSTLDKLLKRNKIKIEDINSRNIKLEINPKAGLTSQRIVKTTIKALSLEL